VNFANGLLNLTNWVGNVIMPTVAGLFAAAAIFHFSKGRNYQHLAYAALASLMCSGLLRVLESFSNQAAWNNPDRYWISILTLVNWVGNVLLPLYGVWQIVLAVNALRRLAGKDDCRRGMGAKPGCGNVFVRIIGTAAVGGVLDSTWHGGGALTRSLRNAFTRDTGEPKSANASDLHVPGV
jgi:hypothetical protein